MAIFGHGKFRLPGFSVQLFISIQYTKLRARLQLLLPWISDYVSDYVANKWLRVWGMTDIFEQKNEMYEHIELARIKYNIFVMQFTVNGMLGGYWS